MNFEGSVFMTCSSESEGGFDLSISCFGHPFGGQRNAGWGRRNIPILYKSLKFLLYCFNSTLHCLQRSFSSIGIRLCKHSLVNQARK
jgi:hypothetical protein